MKRLLIASVLTGLLAASAMAGDMSTSGSPAPGQTSGDGVTGEMPTVGSESLSDSALSGILAALSLLS